MYVAEEYYKLWQAHQRGEQVAVPDANDPRIEEICSEGDDNEYAILFKDGSAFLHTENTDSDRDEPYMVAVSIPSMH